MRGCPATNTSRNSVSTINCWRKVRAVAFKNCHYDLPTGSVGKDYVALLSSKIDLLAQGSVRSERVLVFLLAVLQRDPMVRRGTDIRRLLARHLQRWKDHCFEDLVNETEKCARQLP